jgi:hypothetical protein
MATKKSAGKKTAATVPAIGLAEIVAAGANGIYVSESVFAPLVEAGLVEINTAMMNEAGEVATRATQKGIDSLQPNGDNTSEASEASANSATAATGETQKVKTMFKIEDSIPVPTISGRGRGGNVYPFDQLEVGQSFFVANSEDKPNAAKSLASTVSSATARYAVASEDGATKTNKKGEVVPVMVETRKFVVRSVEENGVKGARVWRTA